MLTGSTTGRNPARESELLEREQEAGAVKEAADAAAAGSGAVALLEGPPGIGKSVSSTAWPTSPPTRACVR